MADDPIYRAIKELREELARIDYIIQTVEAAAEGKPRRGRPPKFLSKAKKTSSRAKRKRRKKASKS